MIVKSNEWGIGIFTDGGKPILFHRHGDDPLHLLRAIGKEVGFEVDYQGGLPEAEYEQCFV